MKGFKASEYNGRNIDTCALRANISLFYDELNQDRYDFEQVMRCKRKYSAFVHLFAKCTCSKRRFDYAINFNRTFFGVAFTAMDEAFCHFILFLNMKSWKEQGKNKS